MHKSCMSFFMTKNFSNKKRYFRNNKSLRLSLTHEKRHPTFGSQYVLSPHAILQYRACLLKTVALVKYRKTKNHYFNYTT